MRRARWFSRRAEVLGPSPKAALLATGCLGLGGALPSTSSALEVLGGVAGVGTETTEVALVPVPTIHELLTAVMLGTSDHLYQPVSVARVEDGRFSLEVPSPGPWWLLATRTGAEPRAWFAVGFETDTLLPTVSLEAGASCVLVLETPGSAWVIGQRSFRNLALSSSRWRGWRPWLRLESGKDADYVFAASRGSIRLTVGSAGYEPAEVDCAAGERVAVRLERRLPRGVEGELRLGGEPLAGAILVHQDGWPVAATDALGRYVAAPSSYAVFDAHGGHYLVALEGGVANLGAPESERIEVDSQEARGDAALAVAEWSAAGELLSLRTERLSGGKFSVVGRTGAAETTLTARGFNPLTLDWSSPAGSPRLTPLQHLKGVAVGPDGVGIAGVEIVVDDGTNHGWLATSLTTGQFQVEVPGQLAQPWLTARASGYRELRQRVSASEREYVRLTPAVGLVGRLVSADGYGVRGTVLLAERHAPGFFVGDVSAWDLDHRFLLRVVRTTDDGTFELDPIAKDGLWLAAAAPEYGTLWRRLPEVSADDRTSILDLGDVVLTPGAALRGRVLEEDGTPIPGAVVRFARSHGPERRVANAINQPIGRAVEGGEGSFSIEGLAVGDSVDLLVSATGFVTKALPRVAVDLALQTEEVDVQLERALEFRGRVTDAATGEGVEAAVHFEQTIRGGSAATVSDSSGEFLLSGFPAGAGSITVRAEGYEDLVHPLSEVPRRTIDLTIWPATLIDVAGTVVRNGEPVAQVAVRIGRASTRTDVSGRFLVRSPSGRKILECTLPGGDEPSRRSIAVAEGMGAITIDVTPVTLRGRVEDAAGAPVAAAQVQINARPPLSLATAAQTGSDGVFATEVEPGTYFLRASKDGAFTPGIDLAVTPREDASVVLALPPERLLRVKVTGLKPSEAAEVLVHVEFGPAARRGSPLPRAADVGLAEPVFETRRYPPAEAAVVATLPSSGRSRRLQIQIEPSGTTEVEIVFSRDVGRIEGVVTLNSQPLSGEPVFVIDRRRVDAWSVLTNHRGAFVIDGLEVGDEIAIATAGQRRAVRVGESTRLDFAARSAVLKGRLVDAETALPAGGLRVSVAPSHSPLASARHVDQVVSTVSGEDGAFVIEGLFAVPYQLAVEGRDGRRWAIVVGPADVDLSAGDLDVALGVKIQTTQ